MEPWIQEAQRQLVLQRQLARLPRCSCCDAHISTDRFLLLKPFGIDGFACESCVEEHMHHWQTLERWI